MESHKHIGVPLSNNLSGEKDIEDISEISNTWLNVSVYMYFKHGLGRKTLEIMYSSFVRPVSEYDNVV